MSDLQFTVAKGSAAADVLLERVRQTTGEGYTVDHDDEHRYGDLAAAASCYALSAYDSAMQGTHDMNHVFGYESFLGAVWPWERESFKPKDARRDLVRAGALILAEIERLDRAARQQP